MEIKIPVLYYTWLLSISMWNQTYDSDSEPITCPKCEIRFNTEIEHTKHQSVIHEQSTSTKVNSYLY